MLPTKYVSVLLIILLVVGMAGYAFSAGFSDLGGHWAEEQINRWAGKGLVAGYTDGTFRPNREITRAEFVALVNRAFGYAVEYSAVDFKDVPAGSWYYEEVAGAQAAGYISGYPGGIFGPHRTITRQEAASILARLLKLDPGQELIGFKDAHLLPQWSRDSMASVVGCGIMSGMPDGCLYPLKTVTRAEAVVLLDRALLFGQDGAGETVDVSENEGNAPPSRDGSSGNTGSSGGNNDDDDKDNGSLISGLEIVKVKGNTVNDSGNMLTIVVGGEIKKIYDLIDGLEGLAAETVVKDVIEKLNIQIEGVLAFSCSFEDLDRDFVPDVFNVLISKHDIAWDEVSESRNISLTMEYAGSQLSLAGSINHGEGCCDSEEGDSGCGSDSSGGTGGSGGSGNGPCVDEASVAEAVYGINIDVQKQEVDVNGSISIALWSEGDADIYAINNVLVEGEGDKLVVEFYKNDVMMLNVETNSVWDSIYTDNAIDLAFNYYHVQKTINHAIRYESQTVTKVVYDTNSSVKDYVYGSGLSVTESVYDGMQSVSESVYLSEEDILIIDDWSSPPPAGYQPAETNHGLDLVNIKGNKVNGKGNMLTLVISGEKDAINRVREHIDNMEIRVEGKTVDIINCTFEDTNLDFKPDVFNVRVKKEGLWPKVKEDRLITVVLIDGNQQVILTKPLSTGGGCGGDSGGCGGCDDENGGGCG